MTACISRRILLSASLVFLCLNASVTGRAAMADTSPVTQLPDGTMVLLRVLDGGGARATNYNVTVTLISLRFSRSEMRCTDASLPWRALEIGALGTNDALSLHVVADDGQAIHTNNVPWTVGATNCVTLTLLRNPCVVAGTLQDDEDKPLAGAEVGAYLPDCSWWTGISGTTDASGAFCLRGLAVTNSALVRIAVKGQPDFLSTNVTVGPQPLSLRFPRQDMLTGRVLCASPDVPARRYRITMHRWYRSPHVEDISGEDGAFSIPLGEHHVLPHPRGTLVITARGYEPAVAYYATGGKETHDVGDIVLKPGAPAGLRGRVVDQDGNPLDAGIRLVFDRADTNYPCPFTFRCRTNGVFGSGLVPPGGAEVQVRYYFGELTARMPVQLRAGEVTVLPAIVATQAMHLINISLLLPDGAAAAGAIVHLAQWCRMRLDGNGQAAARFPSGTYRNGVLVHMNTEYVVEPFTATPQTRSLTLTARPLGAEEAAQRKRRFPWFTPAEAADSGAR